MGVRSQYLANYFTVTSRTVCLSYGSHRKLSLVDEMMPIFNLCDKYVANVSDLLGKGSVLKVREGCSQGLNLDVNF